MRTSIFPDTITAGVDRDIEDYPIWVSIRDGGSTVEIGLCHKKALQLVEELQGAMLKAALVPA